MIFGPQTQFIICAALGAIPVAIWGYIFYQKEPEDRHLVALSFLAGGLSVFPILLYKYSWQFFPWMNAFRYTERFSDFFLSIGSMIAVPMSVVLTFMIVGVIEEWMKHYAVTVVGDSSLKTIDNAIVLSIVAALGFAFVENILYFYDIWLTQGGQNLILPFIFRSLFSTFAHVMFSGIFGYFYGVAHFASPILKEEIRENRHPILKKLHRLFAFKTADLFHREKILEGLIISTVLHAVFNVALELNMAFILVPYLSLGYLLLDHLLKKKENHRVYEQVSATQE